MSNKSSVFYAQKTGVTSHWYLIPSRLNDREITKDESGDMDFEIDIPASAIVSHEADGEGHGFTLRADHPIIRALIEKLMGG